MTTPKVLFLDEVDSTNTYVRCHFDELPDGAMVTARFQSAGRGRQGRRWLAPPGANLSCSIAFKQLKDGFHAGCLTALAALELLEKVAPAVDVYLKWPNDLYVEERKIAGMLCEGAKIEAGRIRGVVAGLGLNVNLTSEMLAEIDQPATSLAILTKQKFNPDFLAERLAEILIRYYVTYLNNAGAVIQAWKKANRLVGEELTVVAPSGQEYTGIFREIRDGGEMVLECGGTVREFSCCDVRIRRESIDWARVKNKRHDRFN